MHFKPNEQPIAEKFPTIFLACPNGWVFLTLKGFPMKARHFQFPHHQ
jgi:hypothetical protein